MAHYIFFRWREKERKEKKYSALNPIAIGAISPFSVPKNHF